MVEQLPVKELVPGSSPGRGANERTPLGVFSFAPRSMQTALHTARARTSDHVALQQRDGAQTIFARKLVEGETPGQGSKRLPSILRV